MQEARWKKKDDEANANVRLLNSLQQTLIEKEQQITTARSEVLYLYVVI